MIEPEVALGTTLNEEDIFEDGQPDSLEILSDAPHLEHPFATYKNLQLVGNGSQTNQFCAAYIGIMGCIDVNSHKVRTLEGVNYSGKIDRRLVHHYCNKPSCCVCYKKGWAVRRAFAIASRLKDACMHPYTYFGVVSYHKLKISVKEHKRCCRICGKELVRLRYSGNRAIVSDVNSPFYEGMSFEDLVEDGVIVYSVAPKRER